MTSIAWNGGPIFRNGAVGTGQECCCGEPPPPPDICCCVGESPVSGTSDYRRIVQLPAGSECEGTQFTHEPTTNPCDGFSLIAEWCGMTVEVAAPTSAAVVQELPGASIPPCGTLTSMTLEFLGLPPGNFASPSGWSSECGRCVVRLIVRLQQVSSDCVSVTKSYFVDYRDGCDNELHVEYWPGGSNADPLYTCDEPPVVSITFAP